MSVPHKLLPNPARRNRKFFKVAIVLIILCEYYCNAFLRHDIIQWNVAVILSACVAADDILLPCAGQETEEFYQRVTDNEEREE